MMELIHLAYLYQPVRKIKKHEQPHSGRTSISDVIVMLCGHVAFQGIQDFLEDFHGFFFSI